MRTAKQIRQQFIDFFVQKYGHTFVPSSSVVPLDDPTLLFTNAGMNQFKDVFLGTGSRPYTRAANTQKCIRAGGKHNDLDDVGKDTYHHTFFEMLGNWSFGDYFKKEAIAWAWELLTEVWGLDPQRLHVTVFGGDPSEGLERDDEAAEIWHSVAGVPRERIHLGSKKDNFWEMGDTGPCGPCTEIHIDRTPSKTGASLVNAGTPEVIEIWNLVFIQYNRGADGKLTPLPAKHVDTGMGFERITAVLQNQSSNYDTDIFTPIFTAIGQVTNAAEYTGKLDDLNDTAYRVIADHIRTLVFALTDGGEPSNLGRGYVIRSVLRRALRYGWQCFGMKKPFLHKLVPAVVEHMSEAFPELKRNPEGVAHKILDEEKAFLRTLDRGMKRFHLAAERAKQTTGVISGKDAFDLHTEQGVFIDITEQMAQEIGLKVDREDYKRRFEEFQKISGQGRKKFVITAVQGELPSTDDSPKYLEVAPPARVIGWVDDNTVFQQGEVPAWKDVALLLDRSAFYAEQGGQVGDTGMIRTETGEFEVADTQRLGDSVLHFGRVVAGTKILVGQTAHCEIDAKRRDIMRNHTVTHLMNFALREVLGDHVEQKGSLVDGDKTRFDFTHSQPLTADEIQRIEEIVNGQIQADLPVTAVMLPQVEAKKLPGVRAVFGEKYPDPVRVVLIGTDDPAKATAEISIEFCGGTHLRRTSEAGLFKVLSQEPVAKGIRRITAVSGRGAFELVQQFSGVVEQLTEQFKCPVEELPARIAALQEELKRLQAVAKKAAAQELQAATEKLLAQAAEVQGTKVIIGEVPAAAPELVRAAAEKLRKQCGSAIVLLATVDEGKVSLLLQLSDDLQKKGLAAGELIKPIAQVVGGSGGGRKDQAQAGGKDPSRLAEALQLAQQRFTEQLGA